MKKTVLITGSSSGFGRLTTETLLKRGYLVIATMLGVESYSATIVRELQAFAKQTSGTIHCIDLDVTDNNSIETAIKTIMQKVDRIDVLVNNAGVGSTGWTEAFTEDKMRKMFDVNVFGVQRMMRAVLPMMRKNKEGLIINFSSIQGRLVFPYSGIYTATKFAVEGMSQSYHYELNPFGIDVVILEPGGFKTNFESIQTGADDAERLSEYGALIDEPAKVWGKPSDDKDFLPSPQPVPEAICKLIEIENGKRPLRTVIDPLLGGEGTKLINNAAERAQEELFNQLGW